MLILSEIIIRITGITKVYFPTKNLYKNSTNKDIGYELVPGFTGKVNGVNGSITFNFRPNRLFLWRKVY